MISKRREIIILNLSLPVSIIDSPARVGWANTGSGEPISLTIQMGSRMESQKFPLAFEIPELLSYPGDKISV